MELNPHLSDCGLATFHQVNSYDTSYGCISRTIIWCSRFIFDKFDFAWKWLNPSMYINMLNKPCLLSPSLLRILLYKPELKHETVVSILLCLWQFDKLKFILQCHCIINYHDGHVYLFFSANKSKSRIRIQPTRVHEAIRLYIEGWHLQFWGRHVGAVDRTNAFWRVRLYFYIILCPDGCSPMFQIDTRSPSPNWLPCPFFLKFLAGQNQDRSNAWSVGLRHSSLTLTLWRRWSTQHSVDSIRPSLSPDLLMSLHCVYR